MGLEKDVFAVEVLDKERYQKLLNIYKPLFCSKFSVHMQEYAENEIKNLIKVYINTKQKMSVSIYVENNSKLLKGIKTNRAYSNEWDQKYLESLVKWLSNVIFKNSNCLWSNQANRMAKKEIDKILKCYNNLSKKPDFNSFMNEKLRAEVKSYENEEVLLKKYITISLSKINVINYFCDKYKDLLDDELTEGDFFIIVQKALDTPGLVNKNIENLIITEISRFKRDKRRTIKNINKKNTVKDDNNIDVFQALSYIKVDLQKKYASFFHSKDEFSNLLDELYVQKIKEFLDKNLTGDLSIYVKKEIEKFLENFLKEKDSFDLENYIDRYEGNLNDISFLLELSKTVEDALLCYFISDEKYDRTSILIVLEEKLAILNNKLFNDADLKNIIKSNPQ